MAPEDYRNSNPQCSGEAKLSYTAGEKACHFGKKLVSRSTEAVSNTYRSIREELGASEESLQESDQKLLEADD